MIGLMNPTPQNLTGQSNAVHQKPLCFTSMAFIGPRWPKWRHLGPIHVLQHQHRQFQNWSCPHLSSVWGPPTRSGLQTNAAGRREAERQVHTQAAVFMQYYIMQKSRPILETDPGNNITHLKRRANSQSNLLGNRTWDLVETLAVAPASLKKHW